MAYRTLEKSFYADSSSDRYANREALYRSRFEADSTIRTGIELENGELFCTVPVELMLANETIYNNERRIAELWASLPHVTQGAFVRSLILDEVVCSNEIEGVHSTRRQIEVALENGAARHGKHAPFLEFAHLYLGLAAGAALPTCPADVRNIFNAVTDGSLADDDKPDGKIFRAGPVLIEDGRGRKLHEGALTEKGIIQLIQQMIELCSRDDAPTVITAAMGHFLFEYAHPFYDGNGRVGRYLLSLYLARALTVPTVLSLSKEIAENKNQYYKGFDAVERPLNQSDATPFVLMLVTLLEQAQDGVITNLANKKSQLEAHEATLSQMANDYSGLQIAALRYIAQMHLFEAFGETSLTGLAEYLGASKATASKLLNAWVESGLLEKLSARPFVCKLTEFGVAQLGLTA